jgi:hypothetical protein
VDCPPLLDVRRLRSNEKCSMCGRCSGHRNAVALSFRSPGSEIVGMAAGEIRLADAFAVCAVLIGLCYGAIHGRDGLLAGHLQGRGWDGDHLALVSVLLTALTLGSVVALLLWLAAGLRRIVAGHLAYSLIPLAGFGLFLGTLEHAFRLLAEAGLSVDSLVFWIRLVFVMVGTAWSWRLGRRILFRWDGKSTLGQGFAHAILLGGLAALYQFAP